MAEGRLRELGLFSLEKEGFWAPHKFSNTYKKVIRSQAKLFTGAW